MAAVLSVVQGILWANNPAGAVERSGGAQPQAPVHLLVSLEAQKIDVYRGTDLIRSAPISSGRAGYRTPTGVFTILEKRRKHFSNLYDDAPMPYMQRLTWTGIALHQGQLPGYPASHGCVRMPRDFSRDLYGLTKTGVQVVVTGAPAGPVRVEHPVLPQPGTPRMTVARLSGTMSDAAPLLRGSTIQAAAPVRVDREPGSNPHFGRPLRMIITPNKPVNEIKVIQILLNRMGYRAGPADGIVGPKTRAAVELYQEGADLPVTGIPSSTVIARIFKEAGYQKPLNATLRVRRKFRDVYQAPVSIRDPDLPIGTHVFTALDFSEGDTGVEWMAVRAEDRGAETGAALLDRIGIPENVRGRLGQMLTPGTSLIVTDRSFKRNTGLGTDFVVITR
ncbi:L,D-transpeptidase family protein [Roseibium sp. RKSG952]|uniref:L,D-transpeptidase family protein n=1 Tax=Roseibium sp. RKSG952 TaxID=2529384 RepID=UPI0012BCBAFB|nr:L,D-transpeptidase family protein [Roseibium sp. RKSG952]MTH96175.1 L,D-transpeptidase [Roseibium sp. RKSG952]